MLSLFLIFLITDAYKLTTDVNAYIDFCSNSYVDEYTEDPANVFNTITSSLNSIYTKEMLDKLNINNIIIIENSDNFCGLFCPPNNIVISTKCNTIKQTFQHEIMHLIDHKLGTSVEDIEWDKLNRFGYLENTWNTETKRQGFISNYAMKNIKEDKAEMYKEFITFSKGNYDKVMIQKFELLFKRLLSFHQDFSKMITNFKQLTNSNTNKYYYDCNIYKEYINSEFVDRIDIPDNIMVVNPSTSVIRLRGQRDWMCYSVGGSQSNGLIRHKISGGKYINIPNRLNIVTYPYSQRTEYDMDALSLLLEYEYGTIKEIKGKHYFANYKKLTNL